MATRRVRHAFMLDKIVAEAKAAGSHYFDRDTLQFFGQTLSDFYVTSTAKNTYVYGKAHKPGYLKKWSVGKVMPDGTIHPVSSLSGSENANPRTMKMWIHNYDRKNG